MSPPNVSRRDRRRVQATMRHVKRSTANDRSMMVVALSFGVLLLILVVLGVIALSR